MTSSDGREIDKDVAIVMIVVEGEVEVTVDDRIYALSQDSLLVIQARERLVIAAQGGVYRLVCFRNFLLSSTADSLVYRRDHARFNEQFIWYRGVTEAIGQSFLTLQKKATVLQFQLLLELINKQYENVERKDAEQPFTVIVDFIRQHAAEPLTRRLVAKRFGYNANYFSESFKKEVGWGFNEFVSHVRIEKAKFQLLSTTKSIQDVAKEVGYEDSLYLSRKFSRAVGLAPSKFRDHTRLENVVALQFTGCLLASGMKPAAVLSSYYNVPQLLQPQVADVQQLSPSWYKEAVTWEQGSPDLIIASIHHYPNRNYIKSLESVAPVVALEWSTYDRMEEVRMIARLVGREEQAEAWIASYKQKVVEAKYQLRASLAPATTVGLYELRNHGRVGLWSVNTRGAYNLYRMLQLPAPERIAQEVLAHNRDRMIEEQEVPLYAADVMFVIVHCLEQKQRLYNELWSSLPAMQQQKVYVLELADFWSGEGVALEGQLQIQMDYLLGTKKSDIYL
ncbi:helix-turn-helix domain-containing protein [Paenibacillus yanchengensis]|uniref:Helix-turn-helix domain-containing protein n=1 Tax=Paenibacillus yanchengensis TaxID=2035833 RepID=A0ABW4YNE5_9BACL